MLDILFVAGLAVVIYMITQLIKTIIDVVLGKDEKGISKRKADLKKFVWLNRIVLPAIPPMLGFLLGAFVPLRPEPLIVYVTAHLEGLWVILAYAFYGAVVGNFSDTIYTKVKALIQDYRSEE